MENKKYPINRIYFFTGLVLVTGFSILVSMLELGQEVELFICSWAIVGVQAGVLLIVLALSNLSGLFKKIVSAQLNFWRLTIPGITIGILFIVLSSLVISFLYGSGFLEPLVYRNVFMSIILIVPTVLLWLIIKNER